MKFEKVNVFPSDRRLELANLHLSMLKIMVRVIKNFGAKLFIYKSYQVFSDNT